MDSVGERLRPELIEAVSFDVNGTLIHAPRLGAIYAEVLARHGRETDEDRLEAAIRQVWVEVECTRLPGSDRFGGPGGAREFWSRFADRVCSHLDLEPPSRFAKAELFDRFSRAESWVVFDEVEAVLKGLDSAGYRLAILSNWDERLPRLLADLDLARYFEAIVFSSAVGVEKPFPGIFSALLEALDLEPETVLHVGDRSREDVEGAIGVGMQAFRVDRREGEETRDLTSVAGLLEIGLAIEMDEFNMRYDG
ncbi:MAG: HAD-IA family hydrolase [Acidobacteriota bacterium]